MTSAFLSHELCLTWAICSLKPWCFELRQTDTVALSTLAEVRVGLIRGCSHSWNAAVPGLISQLCNLSPNNNFQLCRAVFCGKLLYWCYPPYAAESAVCKYPLMRAGGFFWPWAMVLLEEVWEFSKWCICRGGGKVLLTWGLKRSA